jgi:hypothetical protein
MGLILLLWVAALGVIAQAAPQAQSSSSSKHKGSSARIGRDIDSGSITNGVYRNRGLGLSMKVPVGWVLRTEEMNARDEEFDQASPNENPHFSQNQGEVGHPQPSLQGATGEGGRVLLAAFSRPPEARGEDVNSSVVIAAERVASYPGLKEAAQYFGPLTEVAKAQGFLVDEEPYEMQVGSKVVVRGDFHKDVGTRVMRQSTLAFLAQGYAVSITVIGGTKDEVEELIEGVGFGTGK